LWRLESALKNPNFTVIEGDLTDAVSINNIIAKYKPYCVINAGAQSHVHTSFEQPAYTFEVNTVGVIYLLEAIRQHSPETKFVQFSSSEQFGRNYTTTVVDGVPIRQQNMYTEFIPQSPYAISKVGAFHCTRLYRECYKLFACNSINFNSESPRRGEEFVTRKITQYVAKLYHASRKYREIGNPKEVVTPPANFTKLKLGNTKAYRDFSYVPDVVRGIWASLQYKVPDDYIFCTGHTHSIEEFLQEAFGCIGLDYKPYVEIDPRLYRPAEVDYLCGDSSKAKELLGWYPTVGFKDLVKIMVDADIVALERAEV
jgi:GDPmannose 4,6-dehydratase